MFPFCQPHHPDTGFLASPSPATPALINTAVVTQLSFTCFQTAHWEQTLACANLNLAQALSKKMLLGTNQNCHRVCSDNSMVQSHVSAQAHSLIYHKRCTFLFFIAVLSATSIKLNLYWRASHLVRTQTSGVPGENRAAFSEINYVLQYSDWNGKKWFINVPAALRPPSQAYSTINHSVTGQQSSCFRSLN